MPKVGDFHEGLRADEFVLMIDGTVSPGVSKVSGLSEGSLDTIEQPDGATGHVYKLAAAKRTFQPLTIERRVDGSAEDKRFLDWFRQTFRDDNTAGGSAVRKNGMIVKRHFGEDVLKFAFYGAWVKSSAFSDMEAGSTSLFIQTIVLEIEALERVD
jgi:phage tail-like protein